MVSIDAREVDMDHISVELVLMSTDTRISILCNECICNWQIEWRDMLVVWFVVVW